MANYFLVIRNATPDELVKADFAVISDATFDAITLIVQKENPAPPILPPSIRTIKVIYKGRLNIRKSPSASIFTPIVGSIGEGETRAVSEEVKDAGGNIWCKIGENQWIARIFQNNVKAVYL